MRRCNAQCRTTGQPCRNPPMVGARRCRMHGGASPQAQRAAAKRVIETQMRTYVNLMMAERQRQLDELRSHGLTPFTWGLERGLASNPGDSNP